MTPTSRAKVNESGIARAAPGPGRVVGGVDEHRGAAAHDLEPPGRVDRGQPGAQHLDVEAPARPPEERLDRRDGHGRVLRLVGAVQREEQVGVLGREPAHGDLLPPEGDVAGGDAEVAALDHEPGTDLGGALASTSTASGSGWSPTTVIASALMMPAFSVAISSMVSPRKCRWSIPIGVTTQTGASTTFVASHEPPMPTSTTATSTGRSANAAYATATSTSK